MKGRRGALPKLTNQQELELARVALRNNFAPIAKLPQYMDNFPQISRTTISKYLEKHGIGTRIAAEKPQLSLEAINQRLRLSEEGLERSIGTYARTIFIDEFSIDTRKTRQKYVRRLVNERYAAKNVNQYRLRHPKSISFVICFCARALGPMAMIEGRFNRTAYLSYLAHQVIPFGLRIYPDDNYYILHDNCSIHTCAEVQDYLDLVLPNRVLPHPPYSPDLNPCEQIGNYIKREYFQIQNVPNAEADDQARLVTKEEIWATLLRIRYSTHENKTLLNNLATSMHRRYAAVVNARGAYTKY